ncbi:MAG: demethoxyubiquinone hydroxylase family protein [Rhodospirillaceae bacterium TMED8]|nr:demethoxyubiquinone hydroxylase family protein [Magnetovibrio sp.]OUT48110.1 MAG: demethoxyubiquinone hydroxylase family protein [Rhodospirillaceae bacterium TMED8]
MTTSKFQKKSMKSPARLPGDPTAKQIVERIVRVDHAGEYGAVRIYEGQLAVLSKSSKRILIEHMRDQEKIHLKTFSEQISKRKVRPTALLPIWHAAGYALGLTTAFLGDKAAMACTVAVEEAIDEHYASQIKALEPFEDEVTLRETCIKFRQEELEHRDVGLEHGAEKTPGFAFMKGAIKTGSKIAIWLSTRI